jgi:uncharacterized protein with GYD domain
MATYVTLANFTDQGIRNIKESPDRLRAFLGLAEDLGLTVKSVHYTVGTCDLVTIIEGSDEAAATALMKLGSLGNVRTQTMRAFTPEEIRTLVNRMP